MRAQRVGFLLTLSAVTLGFIAILIPFYSAILWAVVFAIIFFPMHARVEARLDGYRNVAAAVSVLICICFVIVPSLLFLGLLVQQASQFYDYVQSGAFDGEQLLEKLQSILPGFLRERLSFWESNNLAQLRDHISTAFVEGGRFFAAQALQFGKNTLELLIIFAIMLYLLFFLFRDGRELTSIFQRFIPLNDRHTRRFTSKFTSVVHATIRSTVIIAVVQSLIAALSFWALGIRPVLLWSVAVGIMSFFPALGGAVIWIPAALYLVFADEWIKAVILVLIGVFGIGLVDNLLRPPLIGQETKLPDYVILLSTVGGIAIFGLNGFILGPLIAALFISFWSLFIDETPA